MGTSNIAWAHTVWNRSWSSGRDKFSVWQLSVQLTWGLWQKPVGNSQQWLMELWTGEFPFEGYLLPCYQTLIGASLLNEGYKMILKPKTSIMLRVTSERHGNAQKTSINGNCLYRIMLPGKCKEEILRSRESLSLQDWLWNCVRNHWFNWHLVPYKQPSTDQHRAAWFVDGNSTVNGQHPLWKVTTLNEEGRYKSAQ